MYIINRISKVEDIINCPICSIDHYQWPRKEEPKAYARIGLLEGRGLIVSMTAFEINPLRRFYEENEPVYRDSAMEVFINFNPESMEQKYMNFEMNSLGTMLSQFGTSKDRKWLCDLTEKKGICKATIEEAQWNVLLEIPLDLIREFHDGKGLETGDEISFNCYKISEEPSIEHYGSYAPIDNPVPNFHLPQFFAKAVIR